MRFSILTSTLFYLCSSGSLDDVRAEQEEPQSEQIQSRLPIRESGKSRSLRKAGKVFTCRGVTLQEVDYANTIQKCRAACRGSQRCVGTTFNERTKVCTLSEYALAPVAAQYCTKTKFITEESKMRNFVCQRGDHDTYSGTSNYFRCQRRCKKNCKGFVYDSDTKVCTVFGLSPDKPRTGDGLRCDKKQLMGKFIVCPCFRPKDAVEVVENILEGSSSLLSGSCDTDTSRNFGLYYEGEEGVQALAVGNNENTCEGTRREFAPTLVSDESRVCKWIIKQSCESLVDAAVYPPEDCPCFDRDRLDTALKQIETSESIDLLSGSCVENDGQIFLNYGDPDSPQNPGYGIFPSTSETDRANCYYGGDILEFVDSLEAASTCFNLLEEACDKIPSIIECPCYDKDDLDSAIEGIKNGDLVLNDGSCVLGGDSISFDYDYPGSDSRFPLGYSTGADFCTYTDIFVNLNSNAQAFTCKTMIEEACGQLAR